ncbi:MAG: phage tail protein [Plesiomonas shigelloides]
MAKYFAILTNLGAGKLANAAALGAKLEMTHIAVGDGGGVSAPEPTPDPAMTALLGEKRRAAINSLSIDPLNPNQIIVEQVIPETDGGFWIREIGLFDKAGTLIAYSNCAGSYKPQLQEGSGRALVIRMILIVSSTEAVSLKIDPSVVLATRKYVDDKVIEVKAYTDKAMADHLAAADAHPQYAKKANVPVALDDMQKMAAALGNNPNYAGDMAVELLGKLVKSKNGSDIPDKNAFRENIGVKSASLKDVGNGPGQIPDMSYYSSSPSSGIFGGWRKTPDGYIEQWVSGETQAVQGVQQFELNLPIPFPRRILNWTQPVISTDDPGQRFASVNHLLSTNTKLVLRAVCPTVNRFFIRVLGE